MSLVSQIQDLALRVASQFRDVVMPRLVPPGGALGQVLRKTSNGDYALGWQTLHDVARTGSYSDLDDLPTLFSGSYDDLSDRPRIPSLTFSTSPPPSPVENDEWVDRTSGVHFTFCGGAWVEFGPAAAGAGGAGGGSVSGHVIRYIGSEPPDTSDWSNDDLWLDTSTEI